MKPITQNVTVKCAIYNFPSCIVFSVNKKNEAGDMTWSIINKTEDSEFYRQDYDLLHNGEKIITISRLHGFGFGSNAGYPILSGFQVKKLRQLLGNNKVDIDYSSLKKLSKEDFITFNNDLK
jgi:hypothetical protein